MRKGFIFDQTLCVNCKACNAACLLENEFAVNVRTVFSLNCEMTAELAVENLSIACNHCTDPVCMHGCPSSAYHVDPNSRAVIVDENKCIGCRYCIWNCPYDAPKYEPERRIISKCTLCYSRLEDGYLPACTEGCPTGALGYGDIENLDAAIIPEWFPESSLDPSLRFRNKTGNIPLKIVPLNNSYKRLPDNKDTRKKLGKEWSLLLFSFFSVISVSLITLSVVTEYLPGIYLFVAVTILPGIFSVFHLGKFLRGWRSVLNIKRSPLSREIILYVIFVLISIYSIIYQQPWSLMAASVTGFLLMISIDSVYYFSIRRLSASLHSGQTFLSALLIISFLSGSVVPFLFIATIKIMLTALRFSGSSHYINIDIIRYIRLALLVIAGASMVSGISYPEFTVIALLITGEFIDRILFYFDFEPTGLNNQINRFLAEHLYEKERN